MRLSARGGPVSSNSMIAIDTNVLVRLLVEDDVVQTQQANKLVENAALNGPVFVSNIVVIELVWVLLSHYRYDRLLLSDAMEMLLKSPKLNLERASAVRKAIAAFRNSRADFADCLIAQVALAAGCQYTATFDVDASKLPGMQLLN